MRLASYSVQHHGMTQKPGAQQPCLDHMQDLGVTEELSTEEACCQLLPGLWLETYTQTFHISVQIPQSMVASKTRRAGPAVISIVFCPSPSHSNIHFLIQVTGSESLKLEFEGWEILHRHWSYYSTYMKLPHKGKCSHSQVDTNRGFKERMDYALSAQLLVNLSTMDKYGHLVCVLPLRNLVTRMV